MKALIFAYLILSITLFACRIHAQDAFARYNDSMAQVKIADAKAQIADSMAAALAQNEPAPQWDNCPLSHNDSLKIDSFEMQIKIRDFEVNTCKRLKDISDVPNRISALRFYLDKKVMTLFDVQKYSWAIKNRIETEIDGTQFLRENLCGKGKMLASAHLKKLQAELGQIEQFVFAISNHDTMAFKPVTEKAKP